MEAQSHARHSLPNAGKIEDASEMEVENQRLKSRLAEADDTIQRQIDWINDLRQKNTEQDRQLSERYNRLLERERQLKTCNDTVTSLEGRVTTLDALFHQEKQRGVIEETNLKRMLEETYARIQLLEQQNELKTAEVTQLENRLKNQTLLLRDKDENLHNVEGKLVSLQAALLQCEQETAAKVQWLENILHVKADNINHLTTALEQYHQEKSTSEQKLTLLKECLASGDFSRIRTTTTMTNNEDGQSVSLESEIVKVTLLAKEKISSLQMAVSEEEKQHVETQAYVRKMFDENVANFDAFLDGKTKDRNRFGIRKPVSRFRRSPPVGSEDIGKNIVKQEIKDPLASASKRKREIDRTPSPDKKIKTRSPRVITGGTSVKWLKCPTCDRTFNLQISYVRHVKLCQSEKSREEENRNGSPSSAVMKFDDQQHRRKSGRGRKRLDDESDWTPESKYRKQLQGRKVNTGCHVGSPIPISPTVAMESPRQRIRNAERNKKLGKNDNEDVPTDLIDSIPNSSNIECNKESPQMDTIMGDVEQSQTPTLSNNNIVEVENASSEGTEQVGNQSHREEKTQGDEREYDSLKLAEIPGGNVQDVEVQVVEVMAPPPATCWWCTATFETNSERLRHATNSHTTEIRKVLLNPTVSSRSPFKGNNSNNNEDSTEPGSSFSCVFIKQEPKNN